MTAASSQHDPTAQSRPIWVEQRSEGFAVARMRNVFIIKMYYVAKSFLIADFGKFLYRQKSARTPIAYPSLEPTNGKTPRYECRKFPAAGHQ